MQGNTNFTSWGKCACFLGSQTGFLSSSYYFDVLLKVKNWTDKMSFVYTSNLRKIANMGWVGADSNLFLDRVHLVALAGLPLWGLKHAPPF